MGALAKKILEALAAVTSLKVKKEEALFGTPPKFKVIRTAALAAINPIIENIKNQIRAEIASLSVEDLIALGLGAIVAAMNANENDDATAPVGVEQDLSDDVILNTVKSNPDLQKIDRYISKDFEEQTADEITLACINDTEISEELSNSIQTELDKGEDFSGDNFIKIVENSSNFDDQTTNFQDTPSARGANNTLQDILDKFGSILPILMLICAIFLLVREYITSNRVPSQFRSRLLQSKIRSLGGLIKRSANTTGQQNEKPTDPQTKTKLERTLNFLSNVDAAVMATALAAALLTKNWGQAQDASFDQLKETTKTLACEDLETAQEVTIKAIEEKNPTVPESSFPLEDLTGFACPIDDTTPVPHMPFDEKILNDFCDVEPELEDTDITPKLYNNLADGAIFENLSNSPFDVKVKIGDRLKTAQYIGNIGSDNIYAPTGGKVFKIEPNKIWVNDIVDGGPGPLAELSEDLRDIYTEINDSKEFIRSFYAKLQYPTILAQCKKPLIVPPPPPFDNQVSDLYNDFIEETNRLNDNYNNTIQTIGGEDNVRAKCEADNAEQLKVDLDVAEAVYFNNIRAAIANIEERAKDIRAVNENYIMIDWYYDVLAELSGFYKPDNIAVVQFQRDLNRILLDRLFIEGHNLASIRDAINLTMNDLDPRSSTINFIRELNRVWNRNLNNSPEKAIRDYINGIAETNTTLSNDDKDILTARVNAQFIFYKDSQEILQEDPDYVPTGDEIDRAGAEYRLIQNTISRLFRRIEELEVTAEETVQTITDIGTSSVPPGIKTIDGKEYEWYGLKGIDRECPIPEEDDPYLSPYSESDYNKKAYWLRYCGIATLMSILPSIIGQAKGYPTPPPGIPFPVIYIPFFGTTTKWGIFVIGLTITGIFPFPFMLFANLSSSYTTPLGDPTAPLKNQVKKLKRELSDNLNVFISRSLQGYMDETKSEINSKDTDISTLELEKSEHKLERPIKERSVDPVQSEVNQARYDQELEEWNEQQADYSTNISNTRYEKYTLERKYKVAEDAQNGGDIEAVGDPKLATLKESQDQLSSSLNSLDALIDSIDIILQPLPITMGPNTSNFGFTLKNKELIHEIADDMDSTVKQGAIDRILQRFELQSDDFMSPNFESKARSAADNKALKTALKLAMVTLLDIDAYPKYENLSPLNLAWIPFLITGWGPAGAKSFGIPV